MALENTLNVEHQGGAVLEIGGELRIASGGKITAAGTQAAAVTAVTITYTTGNPNITPNGAVTIADGATPTVNELLELCVELQAKITALSTALHNAGITA